MFYKVNLTRVEFSIHFQLNIYNKLSLYTLSHDPSETHKCTTSDNKAE